MSRAIATRDADDRGTEDVVSSRFEPVYGKVPLNLRIRADIRAKLDVVVEIWRLRNKAKGLAPKEIDLTHVVERILDDELDKELAHYGIQDLPRDESGLRRLSEALAGTITDEEHQKSKIKK